MPSHFVEADNPNRCQGSFQGGQCRHLALPGDTRCAGCGGVDKVALEAKRRYILADLQEAGRINDLSTDSNIKDLRDEIAILRRLVERRYNLIKTDADLIAGCGPINAMLVNIEKLVKSCHSMEQDLGTLMAKSTVFKLAEVFIGIIIEELANVPGYEDIVDRISGRLIKGVTTINVEPSPKPLALGQEGSPREP